MKLFGKMLLPVTLVFVFVNIGVLAAGAVWNKYGVDRNILLAANLIFFLLHVLAFFLQKRSAQNPNPHAFVRSVIAGMMIKMFAVVIAVLAYVLSAGNAYDKKAVFISLLIYLIYLGAEVSAISKEIRKKNV
jgi:hypothetical protein